MKNKYLFGGFIIVVFLGIMGYLLTQTNISYENDFAKVQTINKTIKATGQWVKAKHYTVDKQKKTFSFYLKDDQGVEIKVVYKGTIPNNFESATSMVVTGKFHNNYFEASDILTKCPSKYEDSYEESSNS